MLIDVGIDPSYTGFAMIALAGDIIVAQKTITTKPDACRPRRLVAIRTECMTFLSNIHEIRLIAIEGYAYGMKFGREEAGELGSVIRVALWEEGFDYLEVPPTSLKKFVTGKGQNPKEVILRDVFKRWGYEAKDNNDADAYGCARLAQGFASDATTWTKGFGEVAAKVELVKPKAFGLRSEAPRKKVV